MHKSVKVISVAATLAIALGACSNVRQVRGYLFDPELANAILPGVDNRLSVQSTLGSPTLPGTFDQDVWYYVSTTVRSRPVFWPDPRQHRVMAVKFAETGAVSEVTNYTLDDTRRIFPVQDKTPTRGRNLNFFQQLFSNIGQVGGGGPGQGPGQQRRGPGPNG